MATTLISKPTLSSAFLGQQLSSRGNSKRSAPSGLFFRAPRCVATDTPYGGNIPQFPRVNVWDPYKRLGISRDASEEEVWSSRNFLLNQYYNHERSAESIEAAFEKILMASFINRKKTKINLKTRLKKKVEESPPWVQNLLSFVELPPAVIILRRLFLFGFMACWSVMNSAEAGPAFQFARTLTNFMGYLLSPTSTIAQISSNFVHQGLDSVKKSFSDLPLLGFSSALFRAAIQFRILTYSIIQSLYWAALGGIVVAISFGACVYFLNDKTKSVGRAALIGFGALVAGWFCGSLLVPMIPPNLLQPTWSLELLTSLFIYVSLFLGCTFLK